MPTLRSVFCNLKGLMALTGVLIGGGMAGAQPTPAQPAKPMERVLFNRSMDLDVGIPRGDLFLYSEIPNNVSGDTLTSMAQWLLVAERHDPNEEILGATFQPIDESLRAQLGLTDGSGLLVSSVRTEGPSAQAGLQVNDILLQLGEQKLTKAEQFQGHLKAAGEKPLPLTLLRAGQRTTLSIRPVYLVTLGPATTQKTEYYLGISLELVSDALRSQLNLPAGKGVLITSVVAESPAQKAGVMNHDILLEMGGTALDSTETVTKLVQANRSKPTTLRLLRGGKSLTLPIAPGTRQVETPANAETYKYYRVLNSRGLSDRPLGFTTTRSVDTVRNLFETATVKPRETSTSPDDVAKRLQQLEKSLEGLQRAVQELGSSIKATRPAPKKD